MPPCRSDYHQPRPVHRDDPAFSLQLSLGMSLPVPSQDEHLPDEIEAFVHQAGLQIQAGSSEPSREGRPGAGPENRRGKAGLVSRPGDAAVHLQDDLRRGYRPAVADQPQARRHHRGPLGQGLGDIPPLHITRNLRDAVCDQFSDRSAGESRAEVCRNAGMRPLGLSTIIDIVHQEGEQLVRANVSAPRGPGRSSEAQLALLGPAVADPDGLTGLVDDDLPLDDSEEAQLEWEQVQAEWIATGFPDASRRSRWPRTNPAVDEGFVIVEPDEVKTKAQPSTGRKEVWTFTAVVLVAGLRYAFAEATAEGLWLQVGAVTPVGGSQRRAPVAGPGRRCRMDSSLV